MVPQALLAMSEFTHDGQPMGFDLTLQPVRPSLRSAAHPAPRSLAPSRSLQLRRLSSDDAKEVSEQKELLGGQSVRDTNQRLRARVCGHVCLTLRFSAAVEVMYNPLS